MYKYGVLLVLVLSYVLLSAARELDSACAKALTHNNTHKHLKEYLGYVSGDIQGVHSDKTYRYKIGICTEPDRDGKPGCAIVQYDTSGNGTSRCIGRLANSQVAETRDHVWTELTYTNGDHYGSHCGKEDRKGRIIFLCDPLIPGKGHIEFLEENRDDDLCYYLFVVASQAVCSTSISVGDIILIILACLVVIWMIAMGIGFLYKRFIVGAKGWEQVPLLKYYREFGNLEADGCDLVCRSSGSTAPSRYKPTVPPFATETDEETDEEKDDNLLPM